MTKVRLIRDSQYPTPAEIDVLTVIASFETSPGGIKLADVAEELDRSRTTIMPRVTRLRVLGMVRQPGPRALMAYDRLHIRRQIDRDVWALLHAERDESRPLTSPDIATRLGVSTHTVDGALKRFRERGAASGKGWLFASPLGHWTVESASVDPLVGALPLRLIRNPMSWRAPTRVAMLIGLAVAECVDRTDFVVIPELAERLEVTKSEVSDVIRHLIRTRYLEPRTP